MKRILVTGGTGVLGREVVGRLLEKEYIVRVISRRARPAQAAPGIEWVVGNLEDPPSLAPAVAGVNAIVHAASRSLWNTRQADVEGTRALLTQARAAGVGHILYISIVGIDRVPGFFYYQAKREAEQIIQAGGVPWSILRATQFFPFLDRLLRACAWGPVALLPTDFRVQPVDVGEVADRLVAAVVAGPGGRLPDFGGPEMLTVGVLARAWLAARQRRAHITRLPVPGRAAAAVRAGALLCPDHAGGARPWAAWLRETYAVKLVRSDYVDQHSPAGTLLQNQENK
jgi:uncharacterized protein YbjT (DUF2867 family)